jgi:glycine/D-amino acid oxidase-like deaminating enzyme
MGEMSDALVIGGGIVGSALALRLADAGLLVARIARPADRSGQASRAAGAMLGVFSEVSAEEPPDRVDLDVRERLAARRLYDPWVAGLAERSGAPVAITPGLFVVGNADGEDDEAGLAAIAAAAVAHGSKADVVGWRDVPGLEPERQARPFGVVYLPDEGSVDTGLLLDALEAVLAAHPGVETVADRAVSIAPGPGDQLCVRLSSGGQRTAGQVVLAGGAETSELLRASEGLDAGVPPVLAGRGVSVTLRAPVRIDTAIRTPNRGFACGTHVVPRAGGVYLGATNRLSTAVTTDRGPTVDELSTLFAAAGRELNTMFRHAQLLSVSVGHRPVTLDGLPLAGRTRHPRLLVASATYRNGILLAPRLAEVLATEILEPGSAAGHPFSPRREVKVAPGGDWMSATAGRSLVAQLCTPDGRLAAGRADELERFLQLMLAALFDAGVVDDGLRRKLNRLAERAPLQEAVPLIFETVARHTERRPTD